jgi:hypothetical protein
MKRFSFAYVVSTAILLTTYPVIAAATPEQGSSEPVTAGQAATVLAQASTSGQRSIIIVSGKNAQPGSLNNKTGSKFNNPASKFSNPGSKVTLNPQPLPPRTSVNPSINSNLSKVTLNPQPLPPKSR